MKKEDVEKIMGELIEIKAEYIDVAFIAKNFNVEIDISNFEQNINTIKNILETYKTI
jgi:hypothetical protein